MKDSKNDLAYHTEVRRLVSSPVRASPIKHVLSMAVRGARSEMISIKQWRSQWDAGEYLPSEFGRYGEGKGKREKEWRKGWKERRKAGREGGKVEEQR